MKTSLCLVRFISTVKSKTPKVTYFSDKSKCMLMESGQDFEAVFYQGPKFTVTADTVKVIDSSGMNITMETESDSKLLSSEVQELWHHVKKVSDGSFTVKSTVFWH